MNVEEIMILVGRIDPDGFATVTEYNERIGIVESAIAEVCAERDKLEAENERLREAVLKNWKSILDDEETAACMFCRSTLDVCNADPEVEDRWSGFEHEPDCIVREIEKGGE